MMLGALVVHITAWRWPHVVLVWAIALGLAYALGRIQLTLLGGRFSWLLPYPGTPRAAWLALRGVAHVAPLLLVALVLLLLAAGLSLYWAATRILR